MRKPDNPCNGCEKRNEIYHSLCRHYKSYRADYETYQEEKRKNKTDPSLEYRLQKYPITV